MIGPGVKQFRLFKAGVPHLEAALRVFTDITCKIFGPKKVTPQLLTVRDQMGRTALEALARGQTLCDFDLQAVEDSHRERKLRGSTKGLRSADGVEVKYEEGKPSISTLYKLPPAKNTPESTNRYHRS